jgi:hypothetical protein
MSRLFSIAAISAAVCAIVLPSVQPAFAMQNIKCIKSGANKQLAAWRTEAGGITKMISTEKFSPKDVHSKLQTLAKHGESLVGACKTCGAEKYAKEVEALNDALKHGIEEFVSEGQVSEKLLGTLDKIAALES